MIDTTQYMYTLFSGHVGIKQKRESLSSYESLTLLDFAIHGIIQLCCAVNQLLKSVVREIRTLRSVGIERG